MPSFNADITATVEVDFEVFCARCGTGLCSQSTGGNTPKRKYPFVDVEPCEKCLDERYEKGYDIGYGQGCSDTETTND